MGLNLVDCWLYLGICKTIPCQEDVIIAANSTATKIANESLNISPNTAHQVISNFTVESDTSSTYSETKSLPSVIEHETHPTKLKSLASRNDLMPMLLVRPADTSSSMACHVVSREIVTSISSTPSTSFALSVVPTPATSMHQI
jgi:hypothetical protein